MEVQVNVKLLMEHMKGGGWTTEAFAKEIGISRASLSSILNEHSVPGYIIMKEMYRALQLTPEQADAIFFAKRLHLT
jgi:transcriptional regulator with XRE-family HTH domain